MSKIFRHGLIACAMAIAAIPATAQVPVTDAMAIAKAVQQLAAWKKQYSQMLTQIKTAKDQLKAQTGKRYLGDIIDEVPTDATVPSSVSEEWRRLTKHEVLLEDALVKTSDALAATTLRAEQVRHLMRAINNTKDPKGVAEIQGRMTAEVALAQLDNSRIRLMAEELQNNRHRIEETYREAMRKNLAKPNAKW